MKSLRYILLITVSLAFAHAADAQEPFKRGIESISFIPKGQWITGVSVNYSQSNQDNYNFLIVEGLNGDTYSFKATPMVMYCFKDNLAVGAKLSYSRDMTKMETGTVVIDSDTDYDIDNLYSLSHKFYGTAVMRNYISMGTSKRFGFFYEAQLQFGGGQAKLCNGSGDDYTGTYEHSFSFDIGLSPGVMMFLTNYSALEVNVGVVGFGYNHTKMTTDQIYVADMKSKSANFKVNLFSITFGVAFYL